jgi:hypothetical protein
MPQRTDEEWLRFECRVNGWPEPEELDDLERLNKEASGNFARAIRAELIAEFKAWLEECERDEGDMPSYSPDIDERFKP